MALATLRVPDREPLVFGYALDTLLATASPLPPLTLKALERQGVFAGRPLHTAYPCAVWPAAIHLLASAALPHLGRDQAEDALGRAFAERFIQARMGTVLQGFAQVVGTEQMLLRLSRALRSTNNFLDVSLEPHGDEGGWELRLHPVREFEHHPRRLADPPHFARGLLTYAFQHGGAPTARLTLVDHDEGRALTTFHVGL
ncbi:DUF2378 family protein [Myxococcus sp. K15C18031901]|uniref:DUF2378 family protein n=1 Tax=Myxococcus dinghuensis TaxID=2906761 RepID=UPI0020A79D24|nr:DUF2378 family protein [Myxococcus dinghuensis]MCP3099184.1 DUF2378 family protein [Myxococcus dinghuensis]